MTTVLAHESELKVELGGPAYRFMQRVAPIQGVSASKREACCQVPVGHLSASPALFPDRGLGIRADARKSLLLDFATYARFFLAAPLLFVSPLVRTRRGLGQHSILADTFNGVFLRISL